ncbi:MAG: glycosyltransferase [Ignavibacteriae bacterium]|nr:glycosyltransferase [Ignavibacteriota bacterium]MCB9242136.1 glycosyltransferase [Ignavibacteriales bacterium]
MSLTDKVIKNTFYNFAAQILGFVFPFFLTPFIISVIGEVQFGIYALVMGFSGTFALFDLSISSSFIKFISENYNKGEKEKLNQTISTGLLFYIIFSILIGIVGFVFTKPLVSLLNIPPDLEALSLMAFRISILIFFITNAFGIFNSILISMQKMYITNIYGIVLNFLNVGAIVFLLLNGYGLIGMLLSQLGAVTISILISYIAAKKVLPEMRIRVSNFRKDALKKMTGFGLQMQVSKLASFASDKYDEFLLGFYSVMNNVAFFNIGARVARLGRFVPYQMVPQVAPVAAELKAKEEHEKLNRLFADTTRYLTIVSMPIFIFIFAFADVIIYSWMGAGFDISVYILRILVIGQLINMIFSAPGNSITPNIGIPKFQMHEGLINLGFNLVLSFILIKFYGIVGAAIGNTISVAISSFYIYIVSSRYFERGYITLLKEQYLKPFAVATGYGIVLFLAYLFLSKSIYPVTGRVSGLVYLIPFGVIYLGAFTFTILRLKYLNENDKIVLTKILMKLLPLRSLVVKRNEKIALNYQGKEYNGELVSLCIVTHNRPGMLKKCINALLPTIRDINYELIIWDNASNDETLEYLKTLEGNERVKVVFHPENIGTNAKGRAIELSRGDFIIGIDDDVIEYPDGWVQKMVEAYKKIPAMGYMSSNVVQDETTDGAKQPDEMYRDETYDNGNIALQVGPAGGWCFMISRYVYNKIGKLAQHKDAMFFMEDEDYANRVIAKGFKFGLLKNVIVYHATGKVHNKEFGDVFDKKMEDYETAKGKTKGSRIMNLFNFKRHYYRLLELAEQEINRE